MNSFKDRRFQKLYDALPRHVRDQADKQFELFRKNPSHPSLGFAKKGEVWTAEIGRNCRAIARKRGDDLYWFWIGSHQEYDKLLSRLRQE